MAKRPFITGYINQFTKSAARKINTIATKINKHLSSFHALHSSLKMDRLDYTFKFSTELVVVTLSLLIIAINAFSGSHLASANNLLAKALALHPERNNQLYAKTTTIKTVVAQDHSVIIPSASAQVVLAASTAEPVQPADLSQSTSVIDNNAIQAENVALRSSFEAMDSSQRRDNLIFSGLPLSFADVDGDLSTRVLVCIRQAVVSICKNVLQRETYRMSQSKKQGSKAIVRFIRQEAHDDVFFVK